MKTTPLLFNSDMVRALLDGRKTMTRRIIKPQPQKCQSISKDPASPSGYSLIADAYDDEFLKCPYGTKGDLIWVRENIWVDKREPDNCCIYDATPNKYKYKDGKFGTCTEADNFLTEKESLDGLIAHKYWYKKPSIHMHKHFSRLTLKITDVRVERVRQISEEDAKAEGVKKEIAIDYFRPGELIFPKFSPSYRGGFFHIWEQINGIESWNKNDWCWVIEFEVIKQNIDDYIKAL